MCYTCILNVNLPLINGIRQFVRFFKFYFFTLFWKHCQFRKIWLIILVKAFSEILSVYPFLIFSFKCFSAISLTCWSASSQRFQRQQIHDCFSIDTHIIHRLRKKNMWITQSRDGSIFPAANPSNTAHAIHQCGIKNSPASQREHRSIFPTSRRWVRCKRTQLRATPWGSVAERRKKEL